MMNERLKILHLEDNPNDAELAERELQKANILFEKIVVDNKTDFIKALNQFNPDVIISDNSLPSFDSMEALKIVKEKGIRTPFILLTATVSEEFAVNIIKQGADDYILKDRMKRLPIAALNAMERNEFEKERQKNLNKIIENEALMKEAQQLANFGGWEVNLETSTVKYSEEASAILGYDADTTAFSFDEFLTRLYPEDAADIKKTITDALKAPVDSVRLNFRIAGKDGSVKYILTELVIKRNDKAVPIRITGFSQDISEQKKAENELRNLTEELRNLAEHIQNVREEERADMAREIHDELGQQLTCLKMDMAWIAKRLNGGDEVLNNKITESMELLNATIKTVRKIATDLRPGILDDLGLIDALQWQSHEFENRSGIEIEFNCSVTEVTLAKNIIIGLFRIYQETLTNVARHANATKIFTTLQQIGDQLILNIRDNGKGFDLLKIHNKKTLGLMGMKERTLMMGGRYVIMSEIGKGTSVLVSVPAVGN